MKRHLLGSLLPLLGLLPACLPEIRVDVETRVFPDGSVERRTVLKKLPKKAMNEREEAINRRPLLDDLAPDFGVGFPERRVTEDEILLHGLFRDPSDIPSDFRRHVEELGREAKNRIAFERRDLLVGTLFVYHERFLDAVPPEDLDDALDALVSFCSRFVRRAVELELGDRYGLAGFDRFLDEELAPALRGLARDFLRERRRINEADPITGETGLERFANALRERLNALGFSLPEPTEDGWSDEVLDAQWRRFLPRLLARTLRPKAQGAHTPKPEDFFYLVPAEQPTHAAKLAAERAAERDFGGPEQAWDAFKIHLAALIGTFSGPLSEGAYRFRYHLTLPGRLLRTTGYLDDRGGVFYSFAGEDLHPDGVEVFAESVVVDTALVAGFTDVRLPLDGRRLVEIVETLRDVKPADVRDYRRRLEEAAPSGRLDAVFDHRPVPKPLQRLVEILTSPAR